MEKYPEYKGLNLAQLVDEISEFWRDHNVFEESIQRRKGNPQFNFYEGPPSANAEPGIHHVLSRTVKDLFCRYKTMQGYEVVRKSGWDTHGLPVELQVEKALGITKDEIGHQISIQEYNEQCRQTVMRYQAQWEKLTQRLGYWIDLKQPYITYDRRYIESVWYLLKQLYEKELIYKGYSIQPYSPGAGTGLSSHEVNQPGCYKAVKDISITAQFKLKEQEETYCLAWTTTPWTLPANSALAIGENITYVKVATFNPYTYQPVAVILAEAALPRYFQTKADAQALKTYQPGEQPIPWTIVDRYMGKDLVGLQYEPLFTYIQVPKPAFTLIPGDFVTTDEGTGLVHIAPTFGADDMRVAKKFGIPAIMVKRGEQEQPIVDKKGRYVAEIKDFAGQYVKEAYETEAVRAQPNYKSVDLQIAIKLKKENKAFQVAKYEHNYPHCWRTDKPILYYPLDAWFVKTTAFKERLVALNKNIHWKPASTGIGRFGHWLEHLVDWNLSRDRFWGTPLPIWRTLDQQEEKCIGSLAELQEEVQKAVDAGLMQKPLPADFDLHRPYVDELVLVSAKGKPMYRETDLIDVWFDSGAMPYAQWHYPFEKSDTFYKHFPADFIAEGLDQTRGWFFTLHVLAGILFDSVAFKNVVSNGLVLDKNGNKMSKRLANSIDPFQVIDQHGSDALRWYMISNSNPWDNLKFDPEGPIEVIRRFFSTLQNTYSFFALYANLDGFYFDKPTIPLAERTEIDRWIISRLHSLTQMVGACLEQYEPTKACRAIQDFVVDDLSNWYVRLNRKRFWKSELSTDKEAAYQTLYTCLVIVAKLAAPIAPFYMERLYQDLNQVTKQEAALSVHWHDWPAVDTAAIDLGLEQKMYQAQTIVSLAHALRKQHQVKVRQPLNKIIVSIADPAKQEQIASIAELILAEVNIKKLELMDTSTTMVRKKAKPIFKSLAQRYKTQVQAIRVFIEALDQAQIKTLEKQGALELQVVNETIMLTLADVLIVSEDIPGWSVANQGEITVALDISLNDTLRREGFARDLVNRIQNMRKEQGLAVQDKIQLVIGTDDNFVRESLQAHKVYICQETQAIQVDLTAQLPAGKTINIEDRVLAIQVMLVP
jgi:isoleucyl-tRNA synthetase